MGVRGGERERERGRERERYEITVLQVYVLWLLLSDKTPLLDLGQKNDLYKSCFSSIFVMHN